MMSKVKAGFDIFLKYGEWNISAEHDIIYAYPVLDEVKVSEEDVKALEELGWWWDDDSDCWAKWV